MDGIGDDDDGDDDGDSDDDDDGDAGGDDDQVYPCHAVCIRASGGND